MGRGEGLVQVHMDHIKPHITGTDLTENGIEIGTIVVEQTARLMHQTGDLLDAALEHADG